MNHRASPHVAARTAVLLARIQALKVEHPFWGYRRCWATLHCVEGWTINKKRVLRVMRDAKLLVTPDLRLQASRTPTTRKPRATAPNQWWGIGMTKVLVESFGGVYVVVVLDWYTKKYVGYHIGLQSTAQHWLQALDMAVNRQFPEGGPWPRAAPDVGQRLPAHCGCVHAHLWPARHHPGVHELQQPQGQRRHRAQHPHAQGGVRVAGSGAAPSNWPTPSPGGSSNSTSVTCIRVTGIGRPRRMNSRGSAAIRLS